MASAPPTPAVAHVKVAVIGSGFGGLGAGVRLRRAGITDFVILGRIDPAEYELVPHPVAVPVDRTVEEVTA